MSAREAAAAAAAALVTRPLPSQPTAASPPRPREGEWADSGGRIRAEGEERPKECTWEISCRESVEA